jgi:hypothetical protein
LKKKSLWFHRNVLWNLEANFIHDLLKKNWKKLACTFNFTFLCIDDVLSLDDLKFGDLSLKPSLRQGIDIYVGHSFMKHSWFNQIQCTYIQECNQSCWIILIWRSTYYILLRHNVLLHICNDYSCFLLTLILTNCYFIHDKHSNKTSSDYPNYHCKHDHWVSCPLYFTSFFLLLLMILNNKYINKTINYWNGEFNSIFGRTALLKQDETVTICVGHVNKHK